LADEKKPFDEVYKAIAPKVKRYPQKIHPGDGVLFPEKCLDVFDIAVRTYAVK
jgi:hypothetical protein